jgi:hypothetical protein
MKVSYHVIPVPKGYEPFDAFYEIETFGQLKLPWWRLWFGRRTWAVIEVIDDV